MKFKLFIILSIIILVEACKHQADIGNIPIKMETNSPLTEFIANEQIIHLETIDKALIGEVGKLYLDSLYIYVLDKIGQEVLIFNKSGKFNSKISAHGRGVAEYIDLSDFAVNNDLVYILSRPNKSILVYNISGEYVQEIKINDWYNGISVRDNYIILYSCKSNQYLYDIVIIDYNGNILNNFMPFSSDNSFDCILDPFNYIGDDNYLLCFPYDRRVAFLGKDSMCEYICRFDFETQVKLSDNEIDDLCYEDIRNKVLYKNSLIGIDNITQVDNDIFYMVVTAFYDEKGIRKALCKVDIKTFESKFFLLGEEIDEKFPTFFDPIFLDANNICTLISPHLTGALDSNPCIGIYDIVK